LAAAAGLHAPPVEVRTLDDRNVLLIKRFDRYWAKPGAVLSVDENLLSTQSGEGRTEHCLGFVSELMLLACDETESHSKAYTDLAQAIRSYYHPSVIRSDNAGLFKRMLWSATTTTIYATTGSCGNHDWPAGDYAPSMTCCPVQATRVSDSCT
jgi:serine/threonine-protein kinase HipA